jgi:tripartite-type tricarboxylate transporter receptor subunit TctC
MLKTTRCAIASCIIGVLVSPVLAQTADYPNKTVRIISDSAAGSSNDVTSRILAEQLSQLWKQQVVVINHPGAGGGISARIASQADPDGYTFYTPAASAFLALKGAPGVSPNLPIVLPTDFLPVAMFTLQPMFVGVSHKLGVKTVKELIDLAKQKPGEISFAATGRGRITHLAMELFQERAGIKLTFVPYAGGPAAAMNDVTSGRIGIVLDGYASLGGAIEGNLIHGIAVASPSRLKEFPNLPAMSETVPGYFAGGWNVVVAPKGTPDPIIRKVGADVNKVLADPDVGTRLAKLGAYLTSMTPEQTADFARKEQETWRPILEKLAQGDGK